MKNKSTKEKILIALVIAIALDLGGSIVRNGLNLDIISNISFVLIVFTYITTYYLLKMITNDNKMILIPATLAISVASKLLIPMNQILFMVSEVILIILNEITKNKVVSKETKTSDKKITENQKKELLIILLAICVFFLFFIATSTTAFQGEGDIYMPRGVYIITETSYSFNIIMTYFIIIGSIYILFKNKNNIKLSSALAVGILMIVTAVITILVTNTNGLGNTIQRNVSDGEHTDGLLELYGYMINIVKPFVHVDNFDWNPMFSIISVFPVPLIIGMWYLYKNDKHEEFLFPFVVGMTISAILAMIGSRLPEILQVITLSKWVNTSDWIFLQGVLGLIVMFYLMSNTDEKLFGFIASMRLTIITLIISAIIPLPSSLDTNALRMIYCVPYTMLAFFLFQYNASKKYQRWCVWALSIFTIIEAVIFAIG